MKKKRIFRSRNGTETEKRMKREDWMTHLVPSTPINTISLHTDTAIGKVPSKKICSSKI